MLAPSDESALHHCVDQQLSLQFRAAELLNDFVPNPRAADDSTNDRRTAAAAQLRAQCSEIDAFWIQLRAHESVATTIRAARSPPSYDRLVATLPRAERDRAPIE